MGYFSTTFSKQKKYSMNYLHAHDFYEFYFQLSGERRYFFDNEYYELTENCLVVIPPHALHKFEGGPYERHVIQSAADNFPSNQIPLLDSLSQKRVVQFSAKEMKRMHKTLNKLLYIFNSETVEDKHLQLSLFMGVLLQQLYCANPVKKQKTLALSTNELGSDISYVILQIMDYIKINYNKNLTLEDLSNVFHLSKVWICKIFLQANGMTIFQYKYSLQLNKAKNLLHTTTHSVSYIAKTTGFSSVSYFSKAFKKSTGSTPLEYRNAFRKIRWK